MIKFTRNSGMLFGIGMCMMLLGVLRLIFDKSIAGFFAYTVFSIIAGGTGWYLMRSEMREYKLELKDGWVKLHFNMRTGEVITRDHSSDYEIVAKKADNEYESVTIKLRR